MSRNPEFSREYSKEGIRLWARPTSCFFCDNCTDIFIDTFSQKPYLWFCKIHEDVEEGLMGKCADFKEEGDNNERLDQTE